MNMSWDGIFVLVGIIIWDIIRSWIIVYWTARKIKKDRKEENEEH